MAEDLNQNHMDSVDSIEFKPATGGLVSSTRKKVHMDGKRGAMMGPDYQNDTGVHTTLSSAVSHMKKHLAHHFSKKDREHEAVGMHKETARKHESAGMKKKSAGMKKHEK